MDPDGDDILVTGYLSAVAAALDKRGIAVITLGRGEQHPDVLSGTLALHPSIARAGHGWGPTWASWHQDTGWSIQFPAGINGHLTYVRYLHRELVPSPTVVAGFIAAVVAGRDIGASAPPQFACNRQGMVTGLRGFHIGCHGHGDPAPPPTLRTQINNARNGRRVADPCTDPAPTEGTDAGSGHVGGGDGDTRHETQARGTHALPALTPQQRQASRAKAASTRAARRQLREQIARGELGIAAVLDRVGADPVVAKTRVAGLLNALPGYDPVSVAALLSDLGIHPDRRAGGLGRRQRQALLDAITPGLPMAGRSGPASAGQGLNDRHSGRSTHRAPR
jgi:hypothetical protein